MVSNGATHDKKPIGTNDGWLIFIQPTIQPHIYDVRSPDGQSILNLKVYLLEVLSASTNYVTFDMANSVNASFGDFGFSAEGSGEIQLSSSIKGEMDENFTATMSSSRTNIELQVQPTAYYFSASGLAKQHIWSNLFHTQPAWVVCWQVTKYSSSMNEPVEFNHSPSLNYAP